MISTAMLARVRTYLNEATAGFWTDAEVYAALTDAQNELIRPALAKYDALSDDNPSVDVPDILASLQKANAVTITSSTGSLPADFLHFVSGTFTPTVGTASPLLRRKQNRATAFSKANPLLTGTAAHEYYMQIMAGSLNLETGSLGGTANIQYIGTPTDIDSTHNATIPANFHDAICQFAYAFLLKKNEDESGKSSLNEFGQANAMRS